MVGATGDERLFFLDNSLWLNEELRALK